MKVNYRIMLAVTEMCIRALLKLKLNSDIWCQAVKYPLAAFNNTWLIIIHYQPVKKWYTQFILTADSNL